MGVLALIVTAGDDPFIILEHPTFEGSVEDGHEFYGHSDALVVTVPHEGGRRATCFKHHHQKPIQCTLVGAEVHATESETPPSLKEIEDAYTPDGWRVYTMEQAAVPYGRALKLFFETDN